MEAGRDVGRERRRIERANGRGRKRRERERRSRDIFFPRAISPVRVKIAVGKRYDDDDDVTAENHDRRFSSPHVRRGGEGSLFLLKAARRCQRVACDLGSDGTGKTGMFSRATRCEGGGKRGRVGLFVNGNKLFGARK